MKLQGIAAGLSRVARFLQAFQRFDPLGIAIAYALLQNVYLDNFVLVYLAS